MNVSQFIVSLCFDYKYAWVCFSGIDCHGDFCAQSKLCAEARVGLLLVLWPLPRGLPNTFINLAAWENLE